MQVVKNNYVFLMKVDYMKIQNFSRKKKSFLIPSGGVVTCAGADNVAEHGVPNNPEKEDQDINTYRASAER